MPKKLIRKATSKSLQTTKYLSSQFKTHTSTAIIAAFGFIIALAWKDFIVRLVEDITQTPLLEKYPYLTDLYTAIIVTIIAIIGISLISKWAQKPEKQQ